MPAAVAEDAPVASPFGKPGSNLTELTPEEKQDFLVWSQAITQKYPKLRYDPSPTADYDLAGFYKAMLARNPKARVSPEGHLPDIWKTKYHRSFSNESMYALPGAPRWKGNQLVTPEGKVV